MSAAAQFVPQVDGKNEAMSKGSIWTGRILSGLVAAFMTLDAAMHILKPPPVVQAFEQLHLPLSLGLVLGIIALACVALYLIPRTAILGAVLMTGYLGGAVAIQITTHHSLFGEILFPVYFGILMWLGLFLRDERVHALAPWRG